MQAHTWRLSNSGYISVSARAQTTTIPGSMDSTSTPLTLHYVMTRYYLGIVSMGLVSVELARAYG